MARLVRSMLIDDVLRRDAIRSFVGWVDVTQIRDCHDAHVQLTKHRNTPIDLLLLDVDLSESSACFPDKLRWSVHQNNLPFCGPLLALPFLGGSPIVVVERYSSYWKRLCEEGYPLAALSVILSVTERRYISPSQVSTSVRSGGDTDKLLTEFPAALRSALRRFRGALKERAEDGDVEFLDMCQTVKQLKRLRDVARDEGNPTIDIPFVTDSEAVAVKYANRSDNAVNSIAVHSLFTDILLAGDDKQVHDDQSVSAQLFGQIISELDSWSKYSHSVCQDVWDVALEAMKQFEQGMEEGRQLAISEVVDSRLRPTSDDTSDRVFFARRLVLVLAWVHAWNTYRDDPEDVSASKRQQEKRKRHVHSLLCLGKSASTLYKRILTTTNMDSEWQAPFFPNEEDEQQRYSLNMGNKSAMLTPYLKLLARKYAAERFGWDGPPYPEWMV